MKNLSGNHISRVWRSGDTIYKRQPKFMCDNAMHAYELLSDTPFVPPCVERVELELMRMTFLVGTPVTDKDEFMWNCEVFLDKLLDVGLRHGDLTRPHVFVIENCPRVIDWAESRVRYDPRPDKRPGGDAFWLWKTVGEIFAENNL